MDGYELTRATNLLGSFLLNERIAAGLAGRYFDRLREASLTQAADDDADASRLLNVAIRGTGIEPAIAKA